MRDDHVRFINERTEGKRRDDTCMFQVLSSLSSGSLDDAPLARRCSVMLEPKFQPPHWSWVRTKDCQNHSSGPSRRALR